MSCRVVITVWLDMGAPISLLLVSLRWLLRSVALNVRLLRAPEWRLRWRGLAARALVPVETLHAQVAPYGLLYTEGLGGATTSDAEHRRLLELCRAKDVDAAERVLRDDVIEAAQSVMGYLSR